ncbi:MAG: LamG-like jellyroll fold domain-containing protein [Myxococcota bacterium]|nr:LamG-like jellyroll fold domain-containing protein [Myxococcota bacterium]
MIRSFLLFPLLFACRSEDGADKLNTIPVIDSVTVTPEGASTSSTVSCSVNASDAESDPLTISHRWVSEAGQELGLAAELTLSPELVQPTQTVTCQVTVSDGTDEATAEASVVLQNSDPAVESVTISPNENVRTNDTLTCTGEASDADLEELSLAYAWSQNGTDIEAGSELALNPSDFAVDDTIRCTVTATDGFGGSGSAETEIVLGNTSPVVESLSLNPSTPTSQDTLTCTVDAASDIDEDEITFSYTWTIDGQEQAETTNVLQGPLEVGSVVVCAVTPNDGNVDGETVSVEAIVQNTTPKVDSVTLGNGPFYTNDTLTASAVLSDVDAEQTLQANYEWHVIDSSAGDTNLLIQNGALDTLDGTVYFDKGDSVYVVVTPFDGVEEGDILSSVPVTIANSLPYDAEASISPSTGVTNDQTLTCSANAQEDDTGDSLSYSYVWSTGATGTTLTLDASVAPGSDISCTATIDDGEDSVDAQSTVTVENRQPTIDGIAVTPSDATAETNLFTCEASGTDADGETPSLTYVWSVDGSVLTSETTSVLSGSYAYGQEISCEATPHDATESGSSSAASVTIQNSLPVVDSVVFDAGSYYTNDLITITASLSDADTAQVEDVNAMYQWHVIDAIDGTDTIVQSGTDNTLDGVSHFDRDDAVYVVVTANDGVEDGLSLTSSSLTVLNTGPTAPSIQISPDPAALGVDDLTCSVDVESTDEDGDSLTYTYVWRDTDGSIQQTIAKASTSDTLLATDATAGTWTCEVHSDDGTLSSTTATASILLEQNCFSHQFGGSDSLAIPAPVFDYSDDFTIEMWVKPDDISGEQILFGVDGSSSNEYRLSIASGGFLKVSWQTVNSCGSGSDTTDVPIFAAEQWTHFAFTSPNLVYKNGELVAELGEDKRGSCFGSGPLYLGDFGSYDGFSGSLYDFRLWTVARSASDIEASFQGLSNHAQESDLRGSWLSTSNYDDRSGNGYDATNTGSVTNDSCPEEDLDGDGSASWEDCNEEDVTRADSEEGASEECAARSCKSILDNGYSTGSAVYWIKPDTASAFQAYCDMDSDGGGWTVFMHSSQLSTSFMSGSSGTVGVGEHKLSDSDINAILSVAEDDYNVRISCTMSQSYVGYADVKSGWSSNQTISTCDGALNGSCSAYPCGSSPYCGFYIQTADGQDALVTMKNPSVYGSSARPCRVHNRGEGVLYYSSR